MKDKNNQELLYTCPKGEIIDAMIEKIRFKLVGVMRKYAIVIEPEAVRSHCNFVRFDRSLDTSS